MKVFNHLPIESAYKIEQYLHGRVRGHYIGNLDPLSWLSYDTLEVVTPVDKRIKKLYNHGVQYVNYSRLLRYNY